MKFGPLPLDQCEGAILAHALRLPAGPDGKQGAMIRKGTVVDTALIGRLATAGIESLVVALPEAEDMLEDDAARAIAGALAGDGDTGIEAADAGTGRVNLHATHNGLFSADSQSIDRINALDPGITLATLAQHTPVRKGQMVATVKIIPYALPGHVVMEAVEAGQGRSLAVSPFRKARVGVVSTKLPALKESVIRKTLSILEARLEISGSEIVDQVVVDHETGAVEAEIRRQSAFCDLIVIFGASAISDIGDVIPEALRRAGGEVERFGMPVDPGNLLMLGRLGSTSVLGAPGCARSPAENGFDLVLNRLIAGETVTSDDIARMGVGGLLLEIGSRPKPRESRKEGAVDASAIVLAAGQSRRMGNANKLLEEVAGKAMVVHAVEAALASRASDVIVVTGHEAERIRLSLSGYDVHFSHNPEFEEGLSTSLRAGIRAVSPLRTHAVVLLGDMPHVSSQMIDSMIGECEAAASGSIVIATCGGNRGNPVIWPRGYFDQLCALTGDTGARHLIRENREKVVAVEIGEAAALDIDTPEALAVNRG
jgi:molybdenum cofactor cytidylyltransferase